MKRSKKMTQKQIPLPAKRALGDTCTFENLKICLTEMLNNFLNIEKKLQISCCSITEDYTVTRSP